MLRVMPGLSRHPPCRRFSGVECAEQWIPAQGRDDEVGAAEGAFFSDLTAWGRAGQVGRLR